jgi:mannose-6-phosphate isomerase
VTADGVTSSGYEQAAAPHLDPVRLGPNYAKYSPQYVGGGGIARFRGIEAHEPIAPEDWVGSDTALFGAKESGLTRLDDGTLLRDAIEKDPLGYLGDEHVAAFGANAGMLAKLLDSASRLNVHLHPSDDFARQHLNCDYGKTEAWIVLETAATGGEVWLGFTRDVDEAELAGWRSTQAIDEMLANLHHVPVKEGSAVLVPAGVPHAIGAHVLVLELQQPTDFSIPLEHRVPPGEPPASGGDLGLPTELALQAVDREAWSEGRLQHLLGPRTSGPGPILPPSADPFFRTELVSGGNHGRLEAGFAVVVAVRGSGALQGTASEGAIPLRRGSTVLVPYGAGPTTVTGDVDVIVCRPGDPSIKRPSRPMA